MTPVTDDATKNVRVPTTADPATLGREFELAGLQLTQSVGAMTTIRDVTDLETVALQRTHISETLAKIDAFFNPLAAQAFALHRSITSRRAAVRAPWEQADAAYVEMMKRFKAEQDRVRREEEQRLAAQQRVYEEEKAAAEAAVLERAGELELAHAVVAQAIAAPTPVVSLPDVTKGVAKFRTVWRWDYVGHSQEAAMRLIPREYLEPNTVAIGKVVTALKDQTKIPGIVVWKDEVPIR